jgi:hypothetical protein
VNDGSGNTFLRWNFSEVLNLEKPEMQKRLKRTA